MNVKILRHKITLVVNSYQKTFPEEYKAFSRQMAHKRGAQVNKVSSFKRTELLERELLEYPETLYDLLLLNLNTAEFKFFETKECTRWFAKEFPQYRVSKLL